MHGIDFIQDLAVILAVAGVVAWGCQRGGLSTVVGYLVAGILVGPHSLLALVSNEERIVTAGQVGLVFLMFAIGLRLSLRKLRRLGGGLPVAVVVSAGLIYYFTRVVGMAAGLEPVPAAYLAGMLMVCSSAIVARTLQEAGDTHERSGQLALGVMLLEDAVAVVMLTLLSASGGPGLGETLGKLGAFVVLAGIAGLLLVPWLLRRMSVRADEELQTVGIAALLFGLALLAQRAGYSLALGAFILGVIVGETPHRHQVERTFAGLRDVFTAVFFVAIGMQIDARELLGQAGTIIALAAFTVVVRTLAATTGLVAIGTPAAVALRAGLAVTPIGEFSFIIALAGVQARVLPEKFYPLAVGVSLLTTVAAPLLTRHSERVAGLLLARQPRWLAAWVAYYLAWLERLQGRSQRNLLWQLSKKRLVQIGVQVLLVTGLLVFSEQMFAGVEGWLGHDWLFPHGPAVVFWLGLMVVVLVPLVALWRNLSALALLYAQVSTQGHPQAPRLAPLVETCLKTGAGAALYVWVASFLPGGGPAKWLVVATVVLGAAALLLLKRKLIYWHSELEVELHSLLDAGPHGGVTAVPWLRTHGDWKLSVGECVLPDLAECQGRKLAELRLRTRLGCSVVGVERQGFMIPLPTAETILYPRDKVLLMGSAEQVAAGRKFLGEVTGTPVLSEFEDVRTELLTVPVGSRAAGRALRELRDAPLQRMQIAGIARGGQRVFNPSADELVWAGDNLLVLGPPERIRAFKAWLLEEPGAAELPS